MVNVDIESAILEKSTCCCYHGSGSTRLAIANYKVQQLLLCPTTSTCCSPVTCDHRGSHTHHHHSRTLLYTSQKTPPKDWIHNYARQTQWWQHQQQRYLTTYYDMSDVGPLASSNYDKEPVACSAQT